ncbi:TPA: hypothetical protein ACKP2Y_000147 [Pseudomonas putida]
MTGFIDWYGHGQVFRLENTYRCPQAICDVSSRFVTKNPVQLRKTVISVTEPIGPAFQVAGKNDIKDGFRQYLDDPLRRTLKRLYPLTRRSPASDHCTHDTVLQVFLSFRFKIDLVCGGQLMDLSLFLAEFGIDYHIALRIEAKKAAIQESV